jgi:hypothetical protein
MTAGAPMDRSGVGDSVGGGDRGEPNLDESRGAGTHAFPTGEPENEPGAAITRDDMPGPGPHAPDDQAPDFDDISSGDGPGQSPGE